MVARLTEKAWGDTYLSSEQGLAEHVLNKWSLINIHSYHHTPTSAYPGEVGSTRAAHSEGPTAQHLVAVP